MSVHKYVTVEIDCDGKNCNECWRDDFINSVRLSDVLKEARADGWMIGRDGRVLCPKCRKRMGRRWEVEK